MARAIYRDTAFCCCMLFACAFTLSAAARDESETLVSSRTVRIDGVGRAELQNDAEGRPVFRVESAEGTTQTMTPDAFARHALNPSSSPGRSSLYRFLNISSPWGVAWVGLGLLGQALFAGRMLVQWVTSERRRRSVVPVAFWWMSLAGASMLLVYFVWRRDVVGVLGQGTGWAIYLRNLVLIYRAPPDVPPAAPAG